MEKSLPSKETTISFDVFSNIDIDSKGNEIDSNGNIINCENNFSYDVISSEYNQSQNNIDEILINENEENNSLKNILTNTPINKHLKINEKSNNDYYLVKENLEKHLEFYKKIENSIISRRNIRSLERHLLKIKNAELLGINYKKFKNNMIKNIKNDSININDAIKKLYT